ncbi:MAG: hypothetical protein ACD_63C00083G0001 [uncultured bacterium]|nr:MAG: hypothetical protein ACD_63C00083G0001 [uncultured bacterium]
MLFKELRQLLAQLKTEITCPNCKRHYEESEMMIAGAINDEAILHLTCSECRSQAIVTAVINRYRENRRHKGLKVRNFEKPMFKEVTSSDVMDIHNFLENFEGDFKTIFS